MRFLSLIGQYNQRSKKLTNNILTCGYWEGTLALDGAGCDFCLYIRQYNQRSKKLTNNILTCGYLEGTIPQANYPEPSPHERSHTARSHRHSPAPDMMSIIAPFRPLLEGLLSPVRSYAPTHSPLPSLSAQYVQVPMPSATRP